MRKFIIFTVLVSLAWGGCSNKETSNTAPSGAAAVEYDVIIGLYQGLVNDSRDTDDAIGSFLDALAQKLDFNAQQLYEIESSLFEPLHFGDNLTLGYAIHDINGDGTPELVILSDDFTILAIYTLRGGKVALVGGYWSRNRCEIGRDGTIYISGSNSAFDSFSSSYSLSTDGDLSLLKEDVSFGNLTKDAGLVFTPFKKTAQDGALAAAPGEPGTAWKKQYLWELNAIQQYIAEFDWDTHDGLYPRYVSNFILADLNFDGTPELIVFGESVFASFNFIIFGEGDFDSNVIYEGLINDGPVLYRDNSGGLFYSFTVLDFSNDTSELYTFTVYSTNTKTDTSRNISHTIEKRAVHSIELSEDGTAYTFNGQAVSEGEYNKLTESFFNGYTRVPGYPLSIANVFNDRDWDTSGGFSESELQRFLDSYKAEPVK